MFDQMTYELQQMLLRIEGLESVGAFEARDAQVMSAVSLAKAMKMRAGYRTIGNADGEVTNNDAYPVPEWAGDIVAYIELPTGEVSYFLSKDNSEWTGYTRAEKLTRINKYIAGVQTEGVVH